MRDALASANGGVDVFLGSAGLEAEEGARPPQEVVSVMREYGLDVSGHEARKLTDEDVEAADLILTMAMHNSSRLLTRYQEAVDRVFTLKEFVIQGEKRGPGIETRDPEARLRELRGWIRNVEGWKPTTDCDISVQLRLFFLHYFHVYDQGFTIDDPLGQSMDFMRRTAEEIRDAVRRLLGPDLLSLR